MESVRREHSQETRHPGDQRVRVEGQVVGKSEALDVGDLLSLIHDKRTEAASVCVEFDMMVLAETHEWPLVGEDDALATQRVKQ